jgi:hypothetical protein|tara:strand:+ start:711 stop:890 length:180 start_codon:yes stop_codon:yes gene_type:complete
MDPDPKHTHPESSNNPEQKGTIHRKSENVVKQETRPSLLDSLNTETKDGKKLRILKDED